MVEHNSVRTFKRLPRFWRKAILSTLLTLPLAVPIMWLLIGTPEAALAGIPIGIVVGFLVHIHEWRTWRETNYDESREVGRPDQEAEEAR
jgi:hypothetical protein